MKHLGFVGSRQRLKIREPEHPAIEKVDHRGHLGLLQHELGNHNRVGVQGPAPRQIPARSAEPLAESASQSRPARVIPRQSGVLDLKLADLAIDQQLLAEARKTVIHILDNDPELMNEENRILRQYFETKSGGISWDKIS
jgi:hypothetical protein